MTSGHLNFPVNDIPPVHRISFRVSNSWDPWNFLFGYVSRGLTCFLRRRDFNIVE